MPQMMPMFWMIMTSFTMSILLITIILIHFLNLPNIYILCPMKKMSKFTYWNWSW